MGTNPRRRPGMRIRLQHSVHSTTNGTNLDNRSLASRGMADDWKARASRIGTTGRRSGDELSRNGRVPRTTRRGSVRRYCRESRGGETCAVENPAPSRRTALLQVIRPLTATRPPMASQDSICQLGSKPISSGRLVFFEYGELARASNAISGRGRWRPDGSDTRGEARGRDRPPTSSTRASGPAPKAALERSGVR